MSFTLTGKFYKKKEIELVSNEFKKREFWVETIEPHSQIVVFQLVQEKVSIIENIDLGKEVKVTFDIRGKEYKKEGEEAKVFVNLQAWKIEY